MNEICFCGLTGAIEDRTYVVTDDRQEALACPNCGHLDFLEYLPALSREATFAIALARTTARGREIANIRPLTQKAA